jgi:hypothetical protein
LKTNQQKVKLLKDLKFYYNYLLIVIGLSIVSWIIWSRFLRTRVPKDIPFHLTEKWFFILIYISIIYFYIVYTLIGYRKANESIKLIVDLLFTPLLAFDKFIKGNIYIQPIYLKLVNKIIIYITPDNSTYKTIKRIYIIFYIIPRLILVSTLYLDTFYFHKIELLYKIILLGAIPLFHRYVKYCLKDITSQYIQDLENKYEDVSLLDSNFGKEDWEHDPEVSPYHDKRVLIKEYFEIVLEVEQFEYTLKYNPDPFPCRDILLDYTKKKYNEESYAKATYEDISYLNKDFDRLAPIVINLSRFLQKYSDVDDLYLISKKEYIIIKHIKIAIFGLYGICWSYIIFKSYHMIPYPFIDTLYELIITLPSLEEPFSGDLFIYWDSSLISS